MTTIDFPGSEGSLRGHLAKPDGNGPWPGLIVLHELFGLDDDIRAHADNFAGAGYLSLAPDLYSWGPTPRCLVATMRAMLGGEGRAYADIDAARGFLASDDRCTGKVGVVGFCMGGGFAILCAARYEFAAAAPNYGRVPKDAETVLAGACPMVGSYGARDVSLRGHPQRLEAALETLDIPHDVKIYPPANHSFMNRHHGIPGVLDRIARIGFHEESSDDAMVRILAFFDEHLRTPTGSADS